MVLQGLHNLSLVENGMCSKLYDLLYILYKTVILSKQIAFIILLMTLFEIPKKNLHDTVESSLFVGDQCLWISLIVKSTHKFTSPQVCNRLMHFLAL